MKKRRGVNLLDKTANTYGTGKTRHNMNNLIARMPQTFPTNQIKLEIDKRKVSIEEVLAFQVIIKRSFNA